MNQSVEMDARRVMSCHGARWGAALTVFVVVALTAGPARADRCLSGKLKALANAASRLANCQAKFTVSDDVLQLQDCKSKTTAKLTAAFTKAGSCAGDLIECQIDVDRCEAEIAETFSDASAAKCESAKRKAAGKLVKAELGCYAKAASKNVALDGDCITKATGKFGSALLKAGSCDEASSSLARVENACVVAAVVVDGSNVMTDLCPATVCCNGPTTTLGPLVCAGGGTAASCTADGGTPVDGASCGVDGCVADTGDPTGCCELGDDCTIADAATCAGFGGMFSDLNVCEESGRCAPRPCEGGVIEDFCGGFCPGGKVCSAVAPSGGGLFCACTTGTASCGGLECGDGCPSGMTCQSGAFCACVP